MKITKQEVNKASLGYWLMMATCLLMLFPAIGEIALAGYWLSLLASGAGFFVFLLVSAASNKKFVSVHAWQGLVVFTPLMICTKFMFRPIRTCHWPL